MHQPSEALGTLEHTYVLPSKIHDFEAFRDVLLCLQAQGTGAVMLVD